MISGLKCFHNFTDYEASDCHHLINKTWILNNRIIIAKTENIYVCTFKFMLSYMATTPVFHKMITVKGKKWLFHRCDIRIVFFFIVYNCMFHWEDAVSVRHMSDIVYWCCTGLCSDAILVPVLRQKIMFFS